MSQFIELAEDPLTWVKAYAARGIRMVVLHGLEDGHCTCSKADCSRNAGKHPVAGAWQKKATADYNEIKDQLHGKTRNIGLAMGHGLVCLDVDVGSGGGDSLEQLMAEHPDWPKGPVARTGGGGLHFIFRTDEDFPNTIKLLPGLDVRSRNGQIVACPSLHRSGNRYTWLAWELPFPELPAWLADLMRGTASTTFDPSAWLMRQPVAVSGENGSKQLMSVAATLIRQGRVRELSAFLRVIGPWNAQCSPPWTLDELTHAFESAFGRFSATATIDLPMDRNGKVVCDRNAVRRIVRTDPRYEFAFQLDAISKVLLYNGAELTDVGVTGIEEELCGRYCLSQINRKWLEDSITASAYDHASNPVTSYLDRLVWDGEARIWGVPERVLGSGDAPLMGSYFAKWMIGAVKRAYHPGCKMETALVLQGQRGFRKSSFFRLLAGDAVFRDSRIDLRNRDSLMQLACWVYEWQELARISPHTIEDVKAFLSTQVDHFRPPYGRFIQANPRTCVIVGSTNAQEILVDPTGDRRLWAVPVTRRIDLDLVARERDQWWAEAKAAMDAGEDHFLALEEETLQQAHNEQFELIDPLYEACLEIIAELEGLPGYNGEINWSKITERLIMIPGLGVIRDRVIARALRVNYIPTRKSVIPGIRRMVWVRRQ